MSAVTQLTGMARVAQPVAPPARRAGEQQRGSWSLPGGVDVYVLARQSMGDDWMFLARQLDAYLQQHGTVAFEEMVGNRHGRGTKPWEALLARAEEARALRASVVRR